MSLLPEFLQRVDQKNYETRCRKLTERVIKRFLEERTIEEAETTDEIIECMQKGKKGIRMEYDHNFPISLAYQIGLPEYIICSPPNLILVPRRENRNKGTKTDYKILDLLKDYQQFAVNDEWKTFLEENKRYTSNN